MHSRFPLERRAVKVIIIQDNLLKLTTCEETPPKTRTLQDIYHIFIKFSNTIVLILKQRQRRYGSWIQVVSNVLGRNGEL